MKLYNILKEFSCCSASIAAYESLPTSNKTYTDTYGPKEKKHSKKKHKRTMSLEKLIDNQHE